MSRMNLTTIDIEPNGGRTNVVMTVDPLHDETWTQGYRAHRRNELDNLEAAIRGGDRGDSPREAASRQITGQSPELGDQLPDPADTRPRLATPPPTAMPQRPQIARASSHCDAHAQDPAPVLVTGRTLLFAWVVVPPYSACRAAAGAQDALGQAVDACPLGQRRLLGAAHRRDHSSPGPFG